MIVATYLARLLARWRALDVVVAGLEALINVGDGVSKQFREGVHQLASTSTLPASDNAWGVLQRFLRAR